MNSIEEALFYLAYYALLALIYTVCCAWSLLIVCRICAFIKNYKLYLTEAQYNDLYVVGWPMFRWRRLLIARKYMKKFPSTWTIRIIKKEK